MQSEKYPGWEIEKIETGLDRNGQMQTGYLMTRPDWEAKGVMYAVCVEKFNGEWQAESQVWVKRHQEYIANKTSVCGPTEMVVKEIEERAAYWLSKR